ncbi:MAG: hypothetical protein K6348_03025 [Deferribacterales bacterium]
MSRRHIGDYLLEMRFVTEADIKEALEYQKKHVIRLGEALIQLGKISRSQLEYIVSKQSDLPYVIITKDQIDMDLLKQFSYDFLKFHKAIPLFMDEHNITVVTDDPFNQAVVEYFESNTGRKISLAVGSLENIEDILNIFVGRIKNIIFDIVSKIDFKTRCRYDFIFQNNMLRVNCFDGENILSLLEEKTVITHDDLKNALSRKGSLLYRSFIQSDKNFCLICYRFDKLDEIVFSDLQPLGLDNVFYSEKAVEGYKFITDTKDKNHNSNIITVI